MVSILIVQRRLGRLTINKVIVCLLVGVVVFNEFLVYHLQAWRWAPVPKQRDVSEEMVILFVSDPQLVGVQDEPRFPLGSITRWDSDRFVQQGFSAAYSHTRPDVVVFLGDLLDEGSKATDVEYKSYLKRFINVFPQLKTTKTVIIPGDNDIGGEGMDFRSPFKVQRFEESFQNITGVDTHGFIDFLKLDIRSNVDKVLEKKKMISNIAPMLQQPLRFIINHETIMTKLRGTVFPILKLAQPNLIVSGHWHLSRIFLCETCLSENEDWPYEHKSLENLNTFIEMDLTNLIGFNEILVPTCSYRMGVPHMGYGVAVVEKSGQLRYTVLWLPSRYTLLYVYVVVLAMAAVLGCVNFIMSPRKSAYR